jgi:hypothetical protein
MGCSSRVVDRVFLGLAMVGLLAATPRFVRGQQDDLVTEIDALVDTVETASWVQTSWERSGRREEYTSARCLWAGQDNMRLDVFDGKGEGATAILFDGRVYGFKRGVLSFIKRSFEPSHPRVRSLRGNRMSQNGFLDDLRFVLEVWDTVTLEQLTPERTAIMYVDADTLSSTLHLIRHPLRVILHERADERQVVERYHYSEIDYNLTIDPELLLP